MPVFIRPALAILVTVALIVIGTIILRKDFHNRLPAQSVVQQLPKNIDVVLKKARFSEIMDGAVVWELNADRVEYDKSGEVAHLAVIRMDFVRGKSTGAITVIAEKGDYFSTRRDILLRGKVHVETEDGISFDTDSIAYNALKSQFITADKVGFCQQRLTLTAVGMEMDVNDQRVRFLKLVEATVSGASLPARSLKSDLKLISDSKQRVHKHRKGNKR